MGFARQNAHEAYAIDPLFAVSQAPAPPPGYCEPKPQMRSSNQHGLEIELDELNFTAALKPLLGPTPRAVRRFVNVYSLTKSMALACPRT